MANRVPLGELDQLHLVGEAAHDSAQRPEQILEPRRADDSQAALAALEVVRLQQPRQRPGSGPRGSGSGRSRPRGRARSSAASGAARPRRSRTAGARRPPGRAGRRSPDARWAPSPRCRGRRPRGPSAYRSRGVVRRARGPARRGYTDPSAPVAQLDRAPASGAGGHRFESCRARFGYRSLGRVAGRWPRRQLECRHPPAEGGCRGDRRAPGHGHGRPAQHEAARLRQLEWERVADSGLETGRDPRRGRDGRPPRRTPARR